MKTWFFRTFSASTLFLLISLSLTAQENRLFTHEIGIAPYIFRNSFPHGVAATLDTIQEMGFTMIEGGGADMDPGEYKKLCDARGFSIPSTGGDYNALLENPAPTIERAKIYGAKYVMVAWIPHEVGNFNIDNAKKAVADFNEIGKTLSEHGLKLAYHAHGYELQPYQNGTLLDYIIRNTDPDRVKFEMDIFWIAFGGGDPVALLDKYPDRWKLMHLKDMKPGINKDHTGLTDPEFDMALGAGQLDIEAIIRKANEIGVEYFFIEDESSRILRQLPESIAYLRSLEK
ncbi:MAG: sugar phosphate isomerase/epimerase [Cyclobacteriaceae bacterium]